MKNSFALATVTIGAILCTAGAYGLTTLHETTANPPGSATLRICGNDQMAQLLDQWENGFRKLHPLVRFENTLRGTASGMYGLDMRTADIALMGRPINPYERYGEYERAWVYPMEIEVATGSEAKPHKSAAYAIFVNKANPLAKLSVEQLNGIFGAERGGGWNALTWDESAARTKDQNIRTWGQLGLGGEWASKPIHPYGPPNLGTGAITAFQTMVMGGGAIFNEDLREYEDRKLMMAELAKDPEGIAYAALGEKGDGVKPLALAAGSSQKYVELTRQTVTDRSYPLARPVYAYYTIDNEKTEIAEPRLNPLVGEFLHYVLSQQGQQAVARSGDYLPLPAPVVAEQLKKMASKDIPAERKLLKDED